MKPKLISRSRYLFIKEINIKSNKTIVCFTPWIRDIPRTGQNSTGFGENLFRPVGYNEIHIIARTNHWYQTDEVVKFLTELKTNNPKCEFVTYGSSMGAYAAIQFAPILNARVLAISPQFSIKRKVVPFEDRWADEAKIIPFIHKLAMDHKSKGLIVYDTISNDAKHSKLILNKRPNFDKCNMSFIGHPAGTALNDLYGLKKFVRFYLQGTVELDCIYNTYHRRKREFAWYWNNICYQLLRKRKYLLLKIVLNHFPENKFPHDQVFQVHKAETLLNRLGK